MATPFLEQDPGGPSNIGAGEVLTGVYVAPIDMEVSCSFFITSMNGVAATITARLLHTTAADVSRRNFYFAKPKHTAANTWFGDKFLPVDLHAGEKLKLYLLSSNAADNAVSWVVDWVTGDVLKAMTDQGYTAARAVYLNELAAANIPTDINTLLARVPGVIATVAEILAGDVDSTGAPGGLPLAKSLEILVAYAIGNANYNEAVREWLLYGRDGVTGVAQVTEGADEGDRSGSTIL